MAFGLSFGKNKTKTSETATKAETTTQSQTGTNTTNTSGSSNTSGSQSGTNTGTSSTTQGTTGTNQQVQTGSSFGNSALTAINDNIGSFIESIMGGGAGAAALSELGKFDSQAFIENVMTGAKATAQDSLDEGVNGLISAIGGNASENSATALLQNKMTNATNASLAGTRAQAEGQAQQILGNRAAATTAAQSGDMNALAQILNSIKGGETTGTATGTNNQTQTGTTNSSETSNQTNNSNTQTQQTAIEMIQQLLNGTTNSVGTSNGTNTKVGGGLSLGL